MTQVTRACFSWALRPEPTHSLTWNFAVLGVAAVFETIAFGIALRELLKRTESGQGFWRAVRTSKDPSVFVVLFEDAAALAGLVVASAGLLIGHLLHNPVFDGIASVVIGAILASVAVFLAYESKGLLLGESAGRETTEKIRTIASRNPAVAVVGRPLTMHFGPDQVLLNLNLEFKQGLSVREWHGQ